MFTFRYLCREMIDNGKDKLEWERKVDSTAVNSIKYYLSMFAFTFTSTNFRDSFNAISDNFAAQFGIILYKVYKISYETYKDIPRGEIKV